LKLIIAKFGADASTPLDKIPLALRREMAEDALRTIGVEVGRDHGGRTAEGVEAVVRQLLVTLLLISLSVLPAIAAELRVTVNGIRSDKGEILIALYNDPAGFARAIANGSRRAHSRQRTLGRLLDQGASWLAEHRFYATEAGPLRNRRDP